MHSAFQLNVILLNVILPCVILISFIWPGVILLYTTLLCVILVCFILSSVFLQNVILPDIILLSFIQLSIILQHISLPSAILLSTILFGVILLYIILLSTILLSVFLPSAILLDVVAPKYWQTIPHCSHFKFLYFLFVEKCFFCFQNAPSIPVFFLCHFVLHQKRMQKLWQSALRSLLKNFFPHHWLPGNK